MKRIIKWYITGIALTLAGSILIAMAVDAAGPTSVPEEVTECSDRIEEQ